jgi:hypothetical protein
VPRTDSPDAARAAWIEAILRDPQAAKRAALEARLAYWRRRYEAHEKKLAAIREQLDAAVFPSRAVRPPDPAAAIFELRAEYGATWADCRHAKAMVAALERELAGAAQ